MQNKVIFIRDDYINEYDFVKLGSEYVNIGIDNNTGYSEWENRN